MEPLDHNSTMTSLSDPLAGVKARVIAEKAHEYQPYWRAQIERFPTESQAVIVELSKSGKRPSEITAMLGMSQSYVSVTLTMARMLDLLPQLDAETVAQAKRMTAARRKLRENRLAGIQPKRKGLSSRTETVRKIAESLGLREPAPREEPEAEQEPEHTAIVERRQRKAAKEQPATGVVGERQIQVTLTMSISELEDLFASARKSQR